MKAIVNARYGPPDILELKEVEKPSPKDGEVLVKVHAASVNAYDWHLLTADIFLVRLMGGGMFKPKSTILGADIAGTVEAVGGNATQFQPGDEVFGDISDCGNGGFAEYARASENRLAPKPANLSFEEAAAVPMAAVTALQGLRDEGKLQPGGKAAIQGASGGVGTFALQLAKTLGAEVTAVCSTLKLDQARSLGADHVIDYTKEDFTQSGQQYDLILAVNGYHPISHYRRALQPEGTCVVVGGSLLQLIQAASNKPGVSRATGQKVHVASLVPSQKDLIFVKELLESGMVVPVIDGCYALSNLAEAFRYFEKVHPQGKVAIGNWACSNSPK